MTDKYSFIEAECAGTPSYHLSTGSRVKPVPYNGRIGRKSRSSRDNSRVVRCLAASTATDASASSSLRSAYLSRPDNPVRQVLARVVAGLTDSNLHALLLPHLLSQAWPGGTPWSSG